MYEADTPQDVVLGEFNYLIECLGISREYGYVYFEANASQAMAELLKERKNFDLIMERRPNVMRAINSEDLSWEELTMRFAWQALDLFKKLKANRLLSRYIWIMVKSLIPRPLLSRQALALNT